MNCRAVVSDGSLAFLLDDGTLCTGAGDHKSVPENDLSNQCIPHTDCPKHDPTHTHHPGCGHPRVCL